MGKTSTNSLLNGQTFSGIEVLGNMPWGSHLCQFYDTRQDLLEILVPYFKTGLESNEFCLWITSDPIDIKDATQALKKSVPELDRYFIEQRIEILSHKEWYLSGGSFDLKRVISGWNEKLTQALERGLTGMRISGNGGWIAHKEWDNFLEYEKEVNHFIDEKRMIVLCTYPLEKSQASDVLDVAFAHDSAFSIRKGQWEIVDVPKNKKSKAQLQMANEELEQRVAERTKDLIATNAELRREIAERKHAEDALRQSEDRIRLIIDTIPIEAWTVRPDGIVDFYNQRWLDYAGEGAIEDPYGIIHPEDLPGIREKWLAKMAAEEPSESEMRIRRADGEYRWFLVRTAPLRDEQGNLVKWYGVSIDIEDSKRAKDELRLAYQRLSYHVENTPLAVIEFDKNLFIKRWSKRAEEIFGWKESEALGKNVYDPDFLIIYEEDIPAVDKINEQLTEGIVNWNLSLNRNYTKHGKVIYSEWYNSVLKDEHGNVITILSLVHNVTERKKAEEQQEFEQREKEALINTTDDLIWSVSTDLKLIAANKAFTLRVEGLTGFTYKPGDYMLIPEVFVEDILAFWKEAYNRALSGETFKKEVYTPAQNNIPESWEEVCFNPVYKNDIVVGLACYSRDITQRKEAEERIRQSEAHLAEAQRLAKLGSWDYDIKTDKLVWSEELYNVFGTDKRTFIETHGSFLDLIDAKDREFALQTSRHTQQTGEPFTIEYHITTPKGEKRIIQELGYGKTDDSGTVVRLFGTAQDITERKKAEIILKEAIVQQSLFSAIVNSSDDAIISKTLDGIITSWNRGAEKIFGYTPNEVVGKPITILIPSDLKLEELDIIARIKRGESVEHYETERVKKDGSRFNVSLTISPVLDSNGIIVGASKILRDITQRKKTEEELYQINEELHILSSHLQNVREEERIQIARDIHDELGQKLTGLKMDVTWLNKKLAVEDEIVKQKIHGIIELIDETLKSIRRISSDLRPSLLDNFGLIAALEWHSEEMAKRSDIKVNFTANIPEPDFIPVAKVTSIFRIYQELLTNALRHANARVINSSLRLHQNHLVLEVRDDGQGMDPVIIASKKTLGLIGIKERTFALGGKYDLKSELGKGTEVKISIPL